MRRKRKDKVVRRLKQTAFITGHTVTAKDRAIAESLPTEAGPGATLVDESVGGPINHPRHYNSHPSGVECINIIRWETGNLAAAIKYIWRQRDKHLLQQIQDLKKAEFYLHDEIERLECMARDTEDEGITLEKAR